jgi:hypothetical protein
MTSPANEPRSVPERVAYLEGRLGMDYGTTSDHSCDDWRARSAWSRGRSAYWDEKIERKFRVLLALQAATGIATVAGILILS